MSVSRSLLALAVAAVVANAGCAKPKPVAVALPPPPLEIPVIPPRVLAPLPEEPVEAALPEPSEPETPKPGRPPRPRRTDAATTARAEPAATQDAPKPETPPETAGGEAKPAPAEGVLRTPETRNDAEAERKVREILTRAGRDLDRVNVGSLGRDARAQFETARRFIDQADGALRVRNYMFANYLADKAEALARGLQGR